VERLSGNCACGNVTVREMRGKSQFVGLWKQSGFFMGRYRRKIELFDSI
jgi:hypothetical protein